MAPLQSSVQPVFSISNNPRENKLFQPEKGVVAKFHDFFLCTSFVLGNVCGYPKSKCCAFGSGKCYFFFILGLILTGAGCFLMYLVVFQMFPAIKANFPGHKNINEVTIMSFVGQAFIYKFVAFFHMGEDRAWQSKNPASAPYAHLLNTVKLSWLLPTAIVFCLVFGILSFISLIGMVVMSVNHYIVYLGIIILIYWDACFVAPDILFSLNCYAVNFGYASLNKAINNALWSRQDEASRLIDDAMTYHQVLYDSIGTVERLAAPHLLLGVLASGLDFCINSYYIIVHMNNQNTPFLLAFSIFRVAQSTSRLLILFFSADSVVQTAKETTLLLRTANFKDHTQQAREKLCQLLARVRHMKPDVSASGFITVSRPSLLTIAGAMATFVVTLLQFQDGYNSVAGGNKNNSTATATAFTSAMFASTSPP